MSSVHFVYYFTKSIFVDAITICWCTSPYSLSNYCASNITSLDTPYQVLKFWFITIASVASVLPFFNSKRP